jgi:chromosome segregation ATPase
MHAFTLIYFRMRLRFRFQALSKRDRSKQLADELSSLQQRIKDVTKKMLASVSELSMYQATALRLQQEMSHREQALEVGADVLFVFVFAC